MNPSSNAFSMTAIASTSDPQEAMILRAIVLSSSAMWQGQLISSQDRKAAFQILRDFKTYPGRIPLCLKWILDTGTTAPGSVVDSSSSSSSAINVATKLYACEQIQEFLKQSYSQLPESERLQVRNAILTAARNLATAPIPSSLSSSSSSSSSGVDAESRILSNKLASLLAAVMVRDFPQRWTTCIEDLFGGLWIEYNPNLNNNTMGIKMCLEILKLVAEDCTDSDFNSKISTQRRNDILIGLNEISSQFLPYLFHALEQITVLTQAKASLYQMRGYLLQNNIALHQMTPDQQSAYQAEVVKAQTTSMIIVDTLSTLENFCRSMPLEWILGTSMDFSAACFHLMREPSENIQLLALECLEQLCLRGKLSYNQWMQWIQELPNAIQQANQQMVTEHEYKQMEAKLSGNTDFSEDSLTVQFDFHRALSRTLSVVLSSHLAHICVYKYILKQEGTEYHAFFNYLRLLVDMCHHPSGRIVSEQMNLWVGLLRDPQISKNKILQPFAAELLNCYMDHMIRIRWDDVEEQTHPQSDLMDASWDDFDDYDAWLGDYRSRSSQLYKLLGSYAPDIAASVLCDRLKIILSTHGNGEPRDHLDPKSQQLTQSSEAVRQLEGFIQPLENILFGLPEWSIIKPNDETSGNRQAIRARAQASLSELANMIVNWKPTYLWLKFRHIQLLEGMKHYWKHEPSTLLQGIDFLLKYIGAPDEWETGEFEVDGTKRISGETIGLRKKSSLALVTVARKVPHYLVRWMSQLGEAAQSLLSTPDINSTNRMHIYEFLSSVATAVEDHVQRQNFVATILSEAIVTLKSPESQEAIASVEGFLASTGVAQAAQNPASVTDISNVKAITNRFQNLYSAINQLLSVAKRCHEAAKKRPNGGIPMSFVSQGIPSNGSFPDEGPVSIRDLSIDDPFIPLWPQILPDVLRVTDVILRLWRPEHQAILLRDRIQRYALAISDDEAYLAKKTDSKDGGVFGEGGTAGSIISGTDRRDANLAPRWSSWFNELRNTCLQMLGLIAAQRVLFAPEISEIYPQFVAVVVDPDNLRAMEHRHFTQYLKQFIEVLLLSCPPTMYMTHLAPIVGPVFEHLQYRLEKTWEPILQSTNGAMLRPLTTNDCEAASALASRGGDEWFRSYYARSGLFVGDLDAETAEAATEKSRFEITRTFSDVLQAALALKGDWALVLANLSREEQASRQQNSQNPKGNKGPPNSLGNDGQAVNADGTPKSKNQAAIDARKLARISAMCHFLFLEHEQIAGFLTLLTIQCLEYPDAYTCRRITRICHRILETVAWYPHYTEILGSRMMSVAVKNIVLEPKWMVGVEWDMINVVRDIYGRLCLGQIVQPGGQGAGLQQPTASGNPLSYEQAKSADKPLQGGGILTTPSDLPKQVLASLPGITTEMIQQLDNDLKRKRSAKDQKDFIRDFLRIAAENYSKAHPKNNILDRAVEEESLLQSAHRKADVEDIPEKLVTQSMIDRKNSGHNKKKKKSKGGDSQNNNHSSGLAAFQLQS